MREIRRCPLTGRRAVLTWGRLPIGRPATRPAGPYPFDVDDHHVLWSDGEPWRVRVVPAGQPALGIEGNLDPSDDGLLERMNGIGAHEVVLVGRDRGAHPADLGPALLETCLRASRDRMRDLRRDRRFRAMTWALVHGEEAGAWLDHPHAQVIAVPAHPPELADSGRLHERYKARTGRCPACDLLEREQAGARWVSDNDGAALVAAWAPRAPFELWVLPRAHQPAFEDTVDGALSAAAELMDRAFRALGAALDGCALSAHLVTLPEQPAFHWRIVIRPQLIQPGGFEAATGWSAHGVWPEEAAEWLRRIL